SVCGEDYQIDWQAVMRLEPGWHCFWMDDDATEQFAGSAIGVMVSGVNAYDTIACLDIEETTLYPIRWYYEAVGGPHEGLTVYYCQGDNCMANSFLRKPLPSRLLRLPCDEGTCGDLQCPCSSGQECDDDSDCEDGLVCGEDNGGWLGQDPSSNVCWNPICNTPERANQCGDIQSTCGFCNPPGCADDADCPGSQVCGL